jgi:hypothetical protein
VGYSERQPVHGQRRELRPSGGVTGIATNVTKRLWEIGDIVDVLERKPVVAGRAIEGKRNTIMVQAND